MKTLYEGILAGMEKTLDKGADDLAAAMDLDKLPTVKSFARNPYNRHQTSVVWECPNVLKRYRNKYSDMITDHFIGIQLCIDNEYKQSVQLDAYFVEENAPVTRKRAIYGWHESLNGGSLATYKRIAIKVINAIAKDPEKLEAFLDYAYKSWNAMRADDPNRFNKYPLKSFITRLL